MYTAFCSKNPKEADQLKDLGLNGSITTGIKEIG
jgi:hypothetical protein